MINVEHFVEILKFLVLCDDDYAVAFKDTILARRSDEFAFTDDACNDEVLFQLQIHDRHAQLLELNL